MLFFKIYGDIGDCLIIEVLPWFIVSQILQLRCVFSLVFRRVRQLPTSFWLSEATERRGTGPNEEPTSIGRRRWQIWTGGLG